jgi:hypothetical protein
MKHLIIATLSFSLLTVAKAQEMKNYDSAGQCTKSATDYLEISLSSESKSLAPIATALLGSVATVGIDIYNSISDKRQKSYSAVYSNSATFIVDSTLYKKLKGYYIIIKRYAINQPIDSLNNVMAEYEFKIVEFSSNMIRLKLAEVVLNKSKARFNSKDNLSIGLDLKLASSSTINSTNSTESSGKLSAKSDSTNNKSNNSNSNQNLGDITIKIPIIKPSSTPLTIPENTRLFNDLYFQGVLFPKNNKVILSISANITEANINHLESGIVDDLLKNHSSDITSILKSIFPSNSTGSSKSQ